MTLFSGIQPTGLLHVGNYFGAIKNWVKLQEKYPSIFCIVDYHAITVPYDPKTIPDKILDLAMDLIACGIDPPPSSDKNVSAFLKKNASLLGEGSILFIQSDVPEVTELTWILNTITPIGELRRMTQFKEKSQQHPESVNMGLFDYPILLAADILLYKAEVVPVGEDQVQHIELTREIARRFNKTFGKTFSEPKPLLTEGARIMSLTDPTKKMSKSSGPETYIALSDSPENIFKKLSTAMTDPARQRKIDPGAPNKCNLYHLHQLVSSSKELDYIVKGCQKAQIGCLECKRLLTDNFVKELAPIQKKRKKL